MLAKVPRLAKTFARSGRVRLRQLEARIRPGTVILTYHRVGPMSLSCWPMAVSEERFKEQMEFVATTWNTLSLSAVAEDIRAGRPAPKAVVVTFDDGYQDNFTLARPILGSHGVPATFFVVAGAVGSRDEFWWDDLDRILLSPGRLPRTLRLDIEGRALQWDLGDASVYSAGDVERHRTWLVNAPPPTTRHALYQALWAHLRVLPEERAQSIMEAMRRWAGTAREARPGNLPMNEDELLQLSRDDLVNIGSHSLTHNYIPGLDYTDQLREAQRSRELLSELTSTAVSSFSYPFGGHSPASSRAVGAAGFSVACTTALGVLRRGADPLALPRVTVGDWDADALRRHLSPFLSVR